MRPRSLVRTAAAAAVLAVLLVGLTAPPIAGGERSHALPPCPPPPPEAGPAPGTVPSLAEGCRAAPSRVEPADPGELPVPRPGYHHLGAITEGRWAGIQGRLAVRDTGVRAGSFDFVATRFLARQDPAGGARPDWLEVGWAEVGWAEVGWAGTGRAPGGGGAVPTGGAAPAGDTAPAGGAARVYAFDSARMSWLFFDEYPLRDGERIWVSLHEEAAAWHAWLWWGGRWRLLASAELPAAGGARLEQYVEVHQDRPGPRVPVPPVQVDHVRVAAGPGGPLVDWRPEQVPTVPPYPAPGYCLTWQRPYHAWSAGQACAGG